MYLIHHNIIVHNLHIEFDGCMLYLSCSYCCTLLHWDFMMFHLESVGATCPVRGSQPPAPLLPQGPLYTSPSTSVPVVLSAPGISPSSRAPVFLSAGIATSITTALFCSSSTATVSAWLGSSSLSGWILKSHRTSWLYCSQAVSCPIGTWVLLIRTQHRCSCTLSQPHTFCLCSPSILHHIKKLYHNLHNRFWWSMNFKSIILIYLNIFQGKFELIVCVGFVSG